MMFQFPANYYDRANFASMMAGPGDSQWNHRFRMALKAVGLELVEMDYMPPHMVGMCILAPQCFGFEMGWNPNTYLVPII